MKSLFAGLLLGTALATGAAFAQDAGKSMGEGLSMLEVSAGKELAMLGLKDIDPMSLTLSQLAEIKSVVGSSNYNNDEMGQQIRKIVSR